MAIRLIEEPHDLLPLREDWDSLLERSPAANPFLTFEWVSSWWKRYGTKRRLFVLAAWDETGSRLKGLAPFMIVRAAGFKVLQFIGTGLADRLNVLVEAGAEDVIEAVFSFLVKRKDAWDLMSLRDVPGDAPEMVCLFHLAARRGWRVHERRAVIAPFLPLRGTWEEFLASKNNQFRKVRRQKEQRISGEGIDFRVRRIQGPFEDRILDDFLEILDKSWKGRDLTPSRRKELIEGFYFDIFRAFAGKGWLDLWLGYLNGRPAAYYVNFDFKGTLSLYNSAYVKEFRRYSPGAVLLGRAVESAFRSGRAECDFLRGDEEFKSRWSPESRTLNEVILSRPAPRSIAAFLAVGVIGRNLKRGTRYLFKVFRERRPGADTHGANRSGSGPI